MNAKLVYLTGGSFVSLLFGIIVTIILPAQEPAGPTELAKPYSEQEARGRDIYLREGCHYCHTQQVRAPEANRGFVRARGDIGPESVPGDFYYQSPVFWGTLRQGTDLTHVASREGVGSNASWHERHFRNPRSMSPGSVMPKVVCLGTLCRDDLGPRLLRLCPRQRSSQSGFCVPLRTLARLHARRTQARLVLLTVVIHGKGVSPI